MRQVTGPMLGKTIMRQREWPKGSSSNHSQSGKSVSLRRFKENCSRRRESNCDLWEVPEGSALRDAVRGDRDGRAPHLDQIDGYSITGIALAGNCHDKVVKSDWCAGIRRPPNGRSAGRSGGFVLMGNQPLLRL